MTITSTLSVRTEGGLLPADLIARVVARDRELPGMAPEQYGLAPGETISEATTRSWGRLRGLWDGFRKVRAQAKVEDALTRETRERWLHPLFQELGYGKLERWEATSVGTKSYAISHRWKNLPIHLIGANLRLDRRTPGVAHAAAANPHGLLQDFLNRKDEFLWGIVSNGLKLRLLRDNATLTRQAYVEFDLESIFDSNDYPGFVILWLLANQSRFDGPQRDEWIIEQWSKKAVESGARALEQLRHGVGRALEHLGTGFLQHPGNLELKSRLRKGSLSAADLKRQLMRVAYRLLFLFVAEDRQLLLDPKAKAENKDRFQRFYSTHRIRKLALGQSGTSHGDAWEQLKLLFRSVSSDRGAPEIAIPVLGGQLFATSSCEDLERASLSNQALFAALRSLCLTREGSIKRKVDFLHLGAEELGSVYESLLESIPRVVNGDQFELVAAAGNDRKTSGSYYTPSSLIQELIRTALDPILELAAGGPSPEKAILDLKVCDPACGSGHFLVAAAHRLARRLAAVRTMDAEPAPEDVRHALREVVSRCIYGVDLNPLSVELCKVSLWLEALDPGKPLAFLDHRIKVGNSLIGATPTLAAAGIPDEAFSPITGDDKAIASGRKKANRKEREGGGHYAGSLFDRPLLLVATPTATSVLRQGDDGTLEGVKRIEAAAKSVAEDPILVRARTEADYWTAAFLVPKKDAMPHFSTGGLRHLQKAGAEALPRASQTLLETLSKSFSVFHWHVEFPDVFDAAGSGGFDVLLGNPPWERVNLSEREYFATRDEGIANAKNAAERQRLIAALEGDRPALWEVYREELRRSEAESLFLRRSGRYPCCGRGDVNTYAVFSELMSTLVAPMGRAGFIVPTGIATDDGNKAFFQLLVDGGRLATLFDFENRKGLFPAVDSRLKFCLITVTGPGAKVPAGDFVFFAHGVEDLRDPERLITLSPEDISRINPNTKTCPIFRSRQAAEITRKIYGRHPILITEARGDQVEVNPWGIRFSRMLHMSDDSHLFRTRVQLERDGWKLEGNRFRKGKELMFPLYEAKLFHQFDHRWSTYVNDEDTSDVTTEEKADPAFVVLPRYWVPERDVREAVGRLFGTEVSPPPFFLAFRDITNNTNERTAIFSLIPYCAVNHKAPLLMPSRDVAMQAIILGAQFNSFASDFIVRQKMGGVSLGFFVLYQLPTIAPEVFSLPAPWDKGTVLADWILPYALELFHTSVDLSGLSVAFGVAGGSFRFDEERRALLVAELDAAFFLLFGFTREEVNYVMGTFPILQRKDQECHGSYRTRDLILDAYDRLGESQTSSRAFQSALIPTPGNASLRSRV